MSFFGFGKKKDKPLQVDEDIDLDPPFEIDGYSVPREEPKPVRTKASSPKYKIIEPDLYIEEELSLDDAELGYDPEKRYSDTEGLKYAYSSIVEMVLGKTKAELENLWGDPLYANYTSGEDNSYMAITDTLVWNTMQLPWLANMNGCFKMTVRFDLGSDVVTDVECHFKTQPWGDTISCIIIDNELLDISMYFMSEMNERVAAKMEESTKQAVKEMEDSDHKRRMRHMEEMAAQNVRIQQGILDEARKPEYTYVCKYCGLQIRSKTSMSSSSGMCNGSYGLHQWIQYK